MNMREKIRKRIKEDQEAMITRRKRLGLPLATTKKKKKNKTPRKKSASGPMWFVSGGLPGSSRGH